MISAGYHFPLPDYLAVHLIRRITLADYPAPPSSPQRDA